MSNLESGSLVGRYRIERFLGAGAMGEVYLAEDPHIGRPLAIKTVRLAGRPQDVEDRKKRLLREARAAGRLLHPNVVTLFDAGEQEGLLYLAFEFVEGSDLASRLEAKGFLSLGEVLGIVRQTADALDYAHRQGIVHRDIKPSNILIDTAGRVKVADFGIAKVAGQSTELTVAGSVMGSPQYLSPEQIRGEELDGRSDIFSLGVVLYELLSSRRPFEGETITTLVYQILHKETPSISELRAVPPRLEELLRRMLAKDRDERLSTAAEVSQELAAIERELPDETLVAPAHSLPPLDRTYALPKRSSGATVTPVATPPPPPIPPPPSPSTRVSAQRAEETRPGGLPPPPPPPVPTPVAPIVMPPPGGQVVVKEGRSWVPLVAVAVAALLLLMTAGGFLGWRWITARRAAQSVAADTAPGPAVPAPVGTVQTAQEPGSSEGEATLPTDTLEPSEPSVSPAVPPVSTRPAEPEPTRPTVRPTETPAESARTSPPVPEPPVRREPPLPRPDRTRQEAPVPTAPSEPAPASPEPTEEEAAAPEEAEPAVRADQELRTGLSLAFRVTPPDAFVLVDRTMIGQAREWSGLKGARTFSLPDAGRYLIRIRKPGMREHRIAVEASDSGGTTPVFVQLKPMAAAEVETSDLPVIRVREAIAFRAPPMAGVLVDGQLVGLARKYSGGMGRGGWLQLPEGRHRVSVALPNRRQDFLVEVFPGAEKERERISVDLTSGGNE